MPLVIEKIEKKEEIVLSKHLCKDCNIIDFLTGKDEDFEPKLCDNKCKLLSAMCVATEEEKKLHCQATIDFCHHRNITPTCYKCPNILTKNLLNEGSPNGPSFIF